MIRNGNDRFKYLDELYKKPPGIEREVFSVETLLDVLVVLYDECNTTQLRRNKHVVDFLEIGLLFKLLLPLEIYMQQKYCIISHVNLFKLFV